MMSGPKDHTEASSPSIHPKTTPHILLHIPHASVYVPASCRDQFVLSDAALGEELFRLTDHATDLLFQRSAVENTLGGLSEGTVQPLVFPVSRFVVDAERFADDDQEPMEERGQGVLYRLTSQGEPLRRALRPGEREHLLEQYYRPHHAELTQRVDRALEVYGRALIIDCHSFPDRPLPVDSDQSPDRPDICIGTDDFHSRRSLVERLEAVGRERGLTVCRNRPYAGTMVPLAHFQRDDRVQSVMLEINRRLYMGEAEGPDLESESFRQVQTLCTDLICAAIQTHTENEN